MGFTLIVLLVLVAISAYWLVQLNRRQQLAFIEAYEFHPTIRKKVTGRYPHLTESQLDMVFEALRSYFHICNKARRKMVAMPSQVVDVAWHEFILFTRSYEQFSKRAIGRFLHHTPTEAMRTPTDAQDGIKRAWRLACVRESINPSAPQKLPLLFAIDGLLEIEDGFKYVLDCQNQPGVNNSSTAAGYCAGHIGCVSGCGGDSGSACDGPGSSCGGSSCGGD